MIDTRFETTINLRGEIENYRQVALIKYYKILLELDPRRDRLTMLAVIRCIDKLERHSQERKRPRNDKKKMLAEGTLAWHYQKRNQLFRKAGIYDIESTQFLVDHEGYTQTAAQKMVDDFADSEFVKKNINPQLRAIDIDDVPLKLMVKPNGDPVDGAEPVSVTAKEFRAIYALNTSLLLESYFYYIHVDTDGNVTLVEQVYWP